jgi:hypothetical protein
MKKTIVILTIALLPALVFAWDNRDYYDERTSQEIRELKEEIKFQQDMRDYYEEKAAYDAYFEDKAPMQRFMSDHYHKGPKKPTR